MAIPALSSKAQAESRSASLQPATQQACKCTPPLLSQRLQEARNYFLLVLSSLTFFTLPIHALANPLSSADPLFVVFLSIFAVIGWPVSFGDWTDRLNRLEGLEGLEEKRFRILLGGLAAGNLGLGWLIWSGEGRWEVDVLKGLWMAWGVCVVGTAWVWF